MCHKLSSFNVGRDVDLLGQLGDGHLEALLDRLLDFLVLVVGNERNRQTLGTETAGTGDAMKVSVGIWNFSLISAQNVIDSQMLLKLEITIRVVFSENMAYLAKFKLNPIIQNFVKQAIFSEWTTIVVTFNFD